MLERKEFAGTSSRDTTRPDVSERVKTRTDAPENSNHATALKGELEETKDKLFDAETRAAAHKAVAHQMRQDRDVAHAELRQTERVVGFLQNRLMEIGGDPKYPELPEASGEVEGQEGQTEKTPDV